MIRQPRFFQFSPRAAVSLLLSVASIGFLAFLLWRSWMPYARLTRLIVRLPSSVIAATIEQAGTADDPLSVAFARFLPRTVGGLPPGVRPRALFYVSDGMSVQPVALLFKSDVRGQKVDAASWQGYLLVGDPEARQRVLGERPSVPSSADQSLAFLDPNAPRTLFIRRSFLAQRHPLLQHLDGPGWDALSWFAQGRRVTFHAHHSDDALRDLPIERQIPVTLSVPLLSIDGLPASAVFPEELPPVLHALKAASGVSEELDNLRTALANRPVSFVLGESHGAMTPLLIFRIDARNEENVRMRVRELFVARLRNLYAAEERIVTGEGRVVRHRRPAPAVEGLLVEEQNGAWMLRAPCGAMKSIRDIPPEELPAGCQPANVSEGKKASAQSSAVDLVAIEGQGVLVAGTSTEAVESTFHALQEEGALPEPRRTLNIYADVERLRSLPITQTVLRAAPEQVRAAIESVEIVDVLVAPARGGTDIRGAFNVRADVWESPSPVGGASP